MKSHKIEIRVTSEEKARYERVAASINMPVSQWVRMRLSPATVEIRLTPEEAAEYQALAKAAGWPSLTAFCDAAIRHNFNQVR
jgi:hypothetical protein